MRSRFRVLLRAFGTICRLAAHANVDPAARVRGSHFWRGHFSDAALPPARPGHRGSLFFACLFTVFAVCFLLDCESLFRLSSTDAARSMILRGTPRSSARPGCSFSCPLWLPAGDGGNVDVERGDGAAQPQPVLRVSASCRDLLPRCTTQLVSCVLALWPRSRCQPVASRLLRSCFAARGVLHVVFDLTPWLPTLVFSFVLCLGSIG